MSEQETNSVEEATSAEETQEQEPTTEPKTFTQDEVNSLLANEKRKVRAQFEDYDTIREKAEKADELTQKLTEATAAREKAELTALRTSISAEHGVPLSALTATSEEDLTAQAKALLEWRGVSASAKRETHSSGNQNGDSGMSPQQRAVQALKNFSY